MKPLQFCTAGIDAASINEKKTTATWIIGTVVRCGYLDMVKCLFLLKKGWLLFADCEVDGLSEEQSVRCSSSFFYQFISSRQRMQEGSMGRTVYLVKGGHRQCRNDVSPVSWLPALDEHHDANRRDGWRLELAVSSHLLLCIS